jgi:hypothetical protein
MKFRYLPKHWQQQAPGRVFDKSNQHWFWVWDHRLRVFGKTRIKELPPVPVTSKPSKSCQVSRKNRRVFGWLFDLFKTLGTAVIYRNWVFVFWGSENRGCEHLEPPWYPAGCFGAVSSVRPTLGTTIVSTTSKGGAQQVRGRQDGEMEFFLVDNGCMRCMWVQEIQDATRVERRIQRSWRRP